MDYIYIWRKIHIERYYSLVRYLEVHRKVRHELQIIYYEARISDSGSANSLLTTLIRGCFYNQAEVIRVSFYSPSLRPVQICILVIIENLSSFTKFIFVS